MIALNGSTVLRTVLGANPSATSRSTRSWTTGRVTADSFRCPSSGTTLESRDARYARNAEGLYRSPYRVRTTPASAAANHASAGTRRRSSSARPP